MDASLKIDRIRELYYGSKTHLSDSKYRLLLELENTVKRDLKK